MGRNLFFFALPLFFAACSPSTGTPIAGDGGGDASGVAPPLTCSEVVDCIVACPSTDTACPDACNAKGSADAQSLVIALAQCINDHACKDSSCTKANCMNEVKACVAQSTSSVPTGSPTDAGVAAATPPPADLIGQWQGSTDVLDIYADGTMHWLSVVKNTFGCTTKITMDRGGTVVVNGDSFTLDVAPGGTMESITCDIVDPPKTLGGSTVTFRLERTKNTATGQPSISLWSIPPKQYPALYMTKVK